MTLKLGDICSYRKEKINVTALPHSAYVSTESMLPNRNGIGRASNIPELGKASAYFAGDVLISNIRPYFKKIWLANMDGGCSNDVLVFKPEKCSSEYLYWLLSSDVFFEYVMSTSKGTKMPRGDKSAIMDYPIPNNDEMAQHDIVSILNPLQLKIELNRQINDYLAELIDALFCELVLGALDLSNTVQFSSVLSERKEKCLSRTNPEYSVTDTGIHPRDSKFHKNLSAATSKNKILRKDDLVFGISRKILNWGLFEDEIGEVSSAYRVYSIRSLPPEYVARYIAHYQHAFTDIIKPSSREGQGIMPDALMAKTIPVLDKEAWNRYVQAVESIKEQIRIVADESDALAELRDTLLPKLMSGEIDVSKVDHTQPNNHL